MGMKILITSGGTTEKIDSVRGITNHSTGNLGKKIAEIFLAHGHDVTLVTTKQALKPNKHNQLDIIEISNVDSLLTTLEPLVKNHDVLIHSMAVSDYTPVYMTDVEEVSKTKDIYKLLDKTNHESKISSQADYQVLFLKKTPKVISKVKEWNPSITLIGFKLLVDVPHQELITVARKSLVTNKADYILANDLKGITPNQHLAYLVNQDEEFAASTKDQIAELIFDKVVTKWTNE